MRTVERDGRHFVEYEDNRGRKIFTDAESFVEDDKDFSERISDAEMPQGFDGRKKIKNQPEEVREKLKGLKGYKRMKQGQRENFLKDKIPDIDE